MTTLLLALIYLAFISLGLPDSLLGAGWPVMHTELQVSVSLMGVLSMTVSAGTIVSSLVSYKVTRKFGTRWVTIFSVFLTAFALFGYSLSNAFWQLILFSIPYGLGAGAIDAALNNYVAQHYSSRDMSWLHCFWGVGTIISPFAMNYALVHSNWHMGYRIIAILQTCIGIVLLLTNQVWNVHQEKGEEEKGKSLSLKEVVRIKGVLYILTGFFCYCALESTSMNWASTYLVEVKGIDPETAAGFASLFYIGITVGRFLSGFITNRLGDRNMIRLGTGILCLGVVMLVLPVQAEVIALAAFIIIGLGCAPIYPCIVHSTPYNFGNENSGAIIGIQMACAYLGSTFMSPLFGVLGKNISFTLLPWYIGFFMAVMIFMTESTFNITGKRKE
ncbi:MAG: MFS transporter [Bulleidia sp.]|nr:MFS transporter [Bulleidia sp.]